MEPLKEMFDKPYYTRLADIVSTIHKPFHKEAFLRQVLEPLPTLSLNERLRHTSAVLKQHLPGNYRTTIAILEEVALVADRGYTALVFPDFVSQFGTHDLTTSLKALHYFTPFGSSEFAVRTFLKMDFDHTIKVMNDWSLDDNEHVRRLSSEGSRPRLPGRSSSSPLSTIRNIPDAFSKILRKTIPST